MSLLAAFMLGLSAGSVSAADSSETGMIITPDQLKWKPSPRVPGLENADMIGDSTKGAYVQRVKFPANFKVEAHTHPEDRTYSIISGTWYVGWGKKFDEAALKAIPAGSFYTEPANVPHFVATKGEPVVVQISGTGATVTKFIDPAHAPKK
jgi:uncharacterized RmlC-like cupin family protein